MFKNMDFEPGSAEAVKAGIRWREKLDYGKTIAGFLSFWFTLQFVLQVMENTIVVMVFGCIYSLYIGVKAGGNEVYDGAEEFSFSLAPPRNIRFKVKFLYGLIPLTTMMLISLLTVKFNLSQYLWSLFVETGLNSPYVYGNKEELFFYGITLLVPLCLYFTIFSASIISWGPGWLPGAVFKGIVCTGIGGIGAAVLYHNMDRTPATVLTFLMFIIIAAACLHRSFGIYIFKEGHSVPKTSTSRGVGAGIPIAIVLIILFFLFFMISVKTSSSESYSEPERLNDPVPQLSPVTEETE